ncbi:hypothetical protein Bca4012_067358 [Brassica carinata]
MGGGKSMKSRRRPGGLFPRRRLRPKKRLPNQPRFVAQPLTTDMLLESLLTYSNSSTYMAHHQASYQVQKEKKLAMINHRA